MKLTVGTFNLNNLFSRFNFEFRAEVSNLGEGNIEFKKIQKIINNLDARSVVYEGKALKHKNPESRKALVRRIQEIDLDVLAVQEVEDIRTLRYFVNHELSDGSSSSLYPHLALVEGNDPRLIDLALLSKYPLGAVTTWQHTTHPDNPNERVFSRDLLQVEILSKDRNRRLLTIFNNHLKSHFVPFNKDQEVGHKMNNLRRQQQAEVAAKIISQEMKPSDRFIVLGDMNDTVDSKFLKPLTNNPEFEIINGLADPTETRPTPNTIPLPPNTTWTHRYKESGKPAKYNLFDHIWLSTAIARKQSRAFIDRRMKLGGDGSDHDPAWVELEL